MRAGPTGPPRRRDRTGWKVARGIGGALAFVTGLLTLAFTALVGDCAAFGGTCPSPEGLQGDILGGLAMGAALMVGGPLVAASPDRIGLIRAVVAAAVVGAIAAAIGSQTLTQ